MNPRITRRSASISPRQVLRKNKSASTYPYSDVVTRKGNPSRWSTRAIFRARRSDKFRHEASSATRNTARFVARLAASSYAVLCTRSFSCLFHALVVASGCAAASAKPSLISALCFPPTPGCHLSPKNFKNPLNVCLSPRRLLARRQFGTGSFITEPGSGPSSYEHACVQCMPKRICIYVETFALCFYSRLSTFIFSRPSSSWSP